MRRVRMLLVLGATCWVAPLGAEPSADSTWSDESSGCPYARAAAEAAAEAQAQPVVVKADAPLLDRRGPAAALLP